MDEASGKYFANYGKDTTCERHRCVLLDFLLWALSYSLLSYWLLVAVELKLGSVAFSKEDKRVFKYYNYIILTLDDR